MFDIFLTEELVTEPASDGKPMAASVYGKICVENFQQSFITNLSAWRREQYEQHWLTALRRLLAEANRSVLITSYVEPSDPDDFLVWWPLYREGDIVYVQNQLLFFNQLNTTFRVDRPWESLQPRKTVNAEGQEISEWNTTVQSIRDFLDRQPGAPS